LVESSGTAFDFYLDGNGKSNWMTC